MCGSPYLTRWKLSTASQFVDLSALQGSAYIVLWYRAMGCSIGRGVCLWPQGTDLWLTEPDLVTMRDGVCLNQRAAVVCHLNSRGNFTLAPIALGPRASARALTKVCGGASLGADAILLEHTLLMPGEALADGETRQGWIAEG